MLTKLIAIGVLFFFLMYLFNARSMKEASLTMVLSGETKVDNTQKEVEAIRKKILLDTIGMFAMLVGIIAVGSVTIPVFISWIIE